MPTYPANTNYAVVIDCGSSGSRLYIYHWNAHDRYELPKIQRLKRMDGKTLSKSLNKPLASFAENPNLAVSEMAAFISTSYNHIPKSKHKFVKVYILATAGMRLLTQSQSTRIVMALQSSLPPLISYELSRVEVISGKMEGLFMWISLNYILGSFQKCSNTHGSFEIGGASMQIAFETDEISPGTFQFNYKCTKNEKIISHNIFAITFLGLGTSAAYKFYFNRISDKITRESEINKQEYSDPCLPNNCAFSDGKVSKTGTGKQEECLKRLSTTFDEYLRRKEDAYAFKNFMNIFRKAHGQFNMSFYGLSEFWYAFHDFLHYQGPIVPQNYWDKNKVFFIIIGFLPPRM